MIKQDRYDRVYLNMAIEWSKLSHCSRKQVGALIVKNDMIISDGYNGTPTGFDNSCENIDGDTNWYVIHAEANAILKCAKYGHSCEGGILQSGIKRLVYIEEYKDKIGLDFLRDAKIEIIKYGQRN